MNSAGSSPGAESPSGDEVSTAGAILIGDELLSGKIQDSNLYPLAGTLRRLGIRLLRVSIIGDNAAVIAREVKQFSADYDVVFTSGGVGPTHDDLTLKAVADAFGVSTHIDDVTRKMLEEHQGKQLTEAQIRMVRVPDSSRLVSTKDVPWPTVVMRNVWVLPGVPQAFAMKLSVIHHELKGSQCLLSSSVYLRDDELDLTEKLNQLVERHPQVSIGSYPRWFDTRYKTKITFDGEDAALLDAARDDLLSLVPAESVVNIE